MLFTRTEGNVGEDGESIVHSPRTGRKRGKIGNPLGFALGQKGSGVGEDGGTHCAFSSVGGDF